MVSYNWGKLAGWPIPEKKQGGGWGGGGVIEVLDIPF